MASASTQATTLSKTADGAGDLPATIQQLDLASQQSPHSATAPSPALHTAQASSSLPEKMTEEEASVATAVLQHQHLSSRKPVSSQQQQQYQQQQQQPEDAAAEPHGHAAVSAEASSAGHESGGKQGVESGPEQLPVPCVSIAGWDESPVSVGYLFHCSSQWVM